MRLLFGVRVPVVDPLNALDDMTEHPLRNVGANAGTAHQAAGSPTKVVQHPGLHALDLGVELTLAF